MHILIDNGSTSSILSHRIYQKLIEFGAGADLKPCTYSLLDVNGKPLSLHGIFEHDLTLGPATYAMEFLVCSIEQDAILGQDFLLKYVDKIDYKRQLLTTRDADIHCWIGGEAKATCRVLSRDTVIIPGNSKMMIPVVIENAEHLGPLGYLERGDSSRQTPVFLTRGILDPHLEEVTIQMVNFRQEPVTVHAKEQLGLCESYYELQCIGTCNHIGTSLESEPFPEHLQDLFKRSSVHLTEEERQTLRQLLHSYQDVFSKSADDLGRTNRVQHRINVGTAQPIRQAPRRLPIGKREIEKQEIMKMLDRKVIEPSNSPWGFRTVLVAKKDGTTRICVDYRALNDVIVKDAYPLPRVDDCLDSLAGGHWFSCLDLNQGFYQVELHPEDRDKTAFSSSQGLYQFTVTPFGLATSPSVFERLMEDVLRGLQWEECLLYMDDIIVPGSTFKEELTRLEHVFQRMRDANLKLKPSKCILFQRSVKFLGHVVSKEGIQTDPEKIESVQNWPIPKNAREIKSFLGLCSYYRKFVKGFADKARPLHQACEKGTRFVWTENCQTAFNTLKEALTSPPILVYPVADKPFILDTDASNFAVGAVLSQEHDGYEHVVAYMSKSMNKHEASYCTTRKELLAVIIALRNFHPYVYGRPILLRTDNAAVSWLKSLKDPTGQVARWLQQLGTYNFTVTHRAGRKHTNADALSRNPCKSCKRQEDLNASYDQRDKESEDHLAELPSTEEMRDGMTETLDAPLQEHQIADITPEDISNKETATLGDIRAITRSGLREKQEGMRDNQELLGGWETTDIRQKQLDDENIGQILVAVEAGTPRPKWECVSSGSSALKTLWGQWDRLEMHGGILYRTYEKGSGQDAKKQMIVPENMKQELLHYFHDIPTAAHLGVDKTLEKLKEGFYWPNMKEYVQNYCRSCDKCFARKPKKELNRAPLGTYLSGEPMERVAMDILGPLPLTKQQNKYILVIVDLFTKWTEAVAIPNQESKTICKAFIDNFITKFGAPAQVHTDQGRNFQADIFQETCKLLGIHKTRTTSFRPQSNGTVERFNRTLASMLAMYCDKQQDQWDQYLQQVMMAYRSSVHASTSMTPNSMIFGREITMPLQAVIPQPSHTSNDDSPNDYMANLKSKLQENHCIARKALKKVSIYQKKRYDASSKKRFLKRGEAVWIYEPARKKNVCSKLAPKWKGPFIIEKRIDDVTYLIKRRASQASVVYHVDRLATYNGRSIPTWAERFRNQLKEELTNKQQ